MNPLLAAMYGSNCIRFLRLVQSESRVPTQAMSTSSYSIRNYQPADFDKYVLLYTDAEKLDPTGRCTSRQFVAALLQRPNYSPRQDLFLAELDEKIVGFMDLKPELGIGRVVLDCWVHPEHRRKGLATKLFGHATSRASTLGARVAHVSVAEDNLVAQRRLSGLGCRLVRRYLELDLDIDQPLQRAMSSCPDIGAYTMPPICHPLRHGEEGKLTQLQNRAFANNWGYNPNTVEETTFDIRLSTCSPDDILLTYEEDRAIGYCWTATICEEGVPSSRRGRILMLGVDPDYGGKGTGKKLMMAGLAHLKSKGLRIAQVTVDSENREACALYWSLGFQVQANTLWYEKAAIQDAATR